MTILPVKAIEKIDRDKIIAKMTHEDIQQWLNDNQLTTIGER